MEFRGMYKVASVLFTFFPACQIFGAPLAYYAHPISLYNSSIEQQDVALIKAMGYEVVNPNGPEHEAGFQNYGMAYFEGIVSRVNVLFFRAFPDGSISAGVAQEIVAMDGRPVVELPSNIAERSLDVGQTLQRLKEAGVPVKDYLRPGDCFDTFLASIL